MLHCYSLILFPMTPDFSRLGPLASWTLMPRNLGRGRRAGDHGRAPLVPPPRGGQRRKPDRFRWAVVAAAAAAAGRTIRRVCRTERLGLSAYHRALIATVMLLLRRRGARGRS